MVEASFRIRNDLGVLKLLDSHIIEDVENEFRLDPVGSRKDRIDASTRRELYCSS